MWERPLFLTAKVIEGKLRALGVSVAECVKSHRGICPTQYPDNAPAENTEVTPSPFRVSWMVTSNQPCLSHGSPVTIAKSMPTSEPTPITEGSGLQGTLIVHPLVYVLQHLWDMGRVAPPTLFKGEK